MNSGCPELEQLEQYAGDPAKSKITTHEHISQCVDCQARLVELTENHALFDELTSAVNINSLLSASPTAPVPQQIGDFDIVREIGRGGMGIVYEARQRHPERRVALKVVRGDYVASRERMRLFDREIRVLARLRHAHITSIFESGIADGNPFYAMEHIEGIAITEYARSNYLHLRQRLQLFLKLCAAISYAHQHAVIHRDLKPSNVLVGQDGEPKVLDFGLARITDSDVTGASLAMETSRIVGTLAYMSPEQTRGVTEDIDVRSDVYSLGVILFELLTGTLPYEVSRTSIPSAVHSICESAPRRPSVAAADRNMDGKSLRGDLDTIILKTLEKSPAHRYQSVSAMAEDIERFLANQPVVARRPSAFYQFKKFAQRNRILVGAIVCIFLALGIGIVTTVIQAHRAREAERQALAEAEINAEINRFLTTMFSSVDPGADGYNVRVVDLLQRAAGDIDKSFSHQPRLAMGLRDAIGSAYKSLTLYAEAEPQFRAALELAQKQYPDDSRQVLSIRYKLAEAMAHTGNEKEAFASLPDILEKQTRAWGAEDPDTLMTKNFLAVLHVDRGNLDISETLLRETLEGRSRSLGPDHLLTLESMDNLGILLRRRGKEKAASQLLHRAHEVALRGFGRDHIRTLVSASNVAMLAKTPAELEAVEPTYRDIVERGTRLLGPNHQQTIAFMSSLVQLLELRCKYDEAESVARDICARLKTAYGENDVRTWSAMKTLARMLALNKNWEEAELLERKLLSQISAARGDAAQEVTDILYDLAHLLNSSGKLEAALSTTDDAMERFVSASEEASQGSSLVRTLRAEILRKLGRLAESNKEATKALDDLRGDPAIHPVLAAWAESNLGACVRDQRRFSEAETILLHAYEELLKTLEPCHPTCVEARQKIVELYEMWHASDVGEGHDQQRIDFEAKYPSPSNP